MNLFTVLRARNARFNGQAYGLQDNKEGVVTQMQSFMPADRTWPSLLDPVAFAAGFVLWGLCHSAL